MRVHGYCTGCRKVTLVKVRDSALALAAALRGGAQGICSACEEAAKNKRQPSGRAQR